MLKLLNTESMDEAFQEAIERQAFKENKATEAEIRGWFNTNRTDIEQEMESLVREAVRRIVSPRPVVTAPVVKLDRPDGSTLALWVYDAAQNCNVSEHRSMQFGGDPAAGLVYQCKSRGSGNHANEHSLNDENTWAWVQKWMKIGMDSSDFLPDLKASHGFNDLPEGIKSRVETLLGQVNQ